MAITSFGKAQLASFAHKLIRPPSPNKVLVTLSSGSVIHQTTMKPCLQGTQGHITPDTPIIKKKDWIAFISCLKFLVGGISLRTLQQCVPSKYDTVLSITCTQPPRKYSAASYEKGQ